MSAMDDYPYSIVNGVGLHARMCDEIDRLRTIKKTDDGAYEHVVEMYHAVVADAENLITRLNRQASEIARLQVGAKWRDAGELQRIIAPVLKRLYPQNPDVVLGREARAIAEALVAGGTDVWADTRSANWQHHGRDTRTIEEIAGVEPSGDR